MANKQSKTRLEVERQKLGLTQAELAEKIDTPTNTYSRWERGEQNPGSYHLRKLTTFFGEKVDASWCHPEATKESSSPYYIPYAPNRYFTDPRNLIQFLHARLTSQESGMSHLSISGLGGIGKTQLALEYACRYRSDYTAIFWVRAGTQSQLIADFIRIAHLLQLPETRRSKPNQRYLANEVIQWLQMHPGWLLVFDNVEEDPDEEKNENKEKDFKIDHLLSLLTEGHILLTTRAQSVGNLVQNFLLEEMQPEEGAQFLLSRTHILTSPAILSALNRSTHKAALALSELLGGLPLALEHAAAYVLETRCGLTKYYETYESYRKDLLHYKIKYPRLYTDYDESVATTWLISFQRVEQQLPIASDLLKLCAYLAPDSIPEDIFLRGALKLDSNLSELAGNPILLNRVCQVLINYSLIKRYAEGTMLSLHRLVQAVLQDRMDEEETQRYWVEQAMRAVEQAFSSVIDQDVSRYIPHAHMCSEFIKKLGLKGQEAIHLLEMAADAEYERGWYAQSNPLYLRALGAFPDSLDEKADPHKLHIMLNIAQVQMKLGVYALAAVIYQGAREKMEQTPGPQYSDIVSCLNNLALAQMQLGSLEAIQTCQEALSWYHQGHVTDPVLRARTYHITAEVYGHAGRGHTAKAYYQSSLMLRERILGKDHPDVAESLTALGAFYLLHQNLVKAEPLLQRGWDIRQKVLGFEHPDTVDSLVYLAMLSWDQRDYLQAEKRYHQALDIRRQKLGLYHPSILQIIHDLAELSTDEQKDEEADHYFREMLALGFWLTLGEG